MTKQKILNELDTNPFILKTVDKKYLSDKSFMLEAAKIDDVVMAFVSEEILSDKKFMSELIASSVECLRFTSQSLRDDDTFMLPLIKKNYEVLKYASLALRSDKELILSLVDNAPYIINLISIELRDNKNFMLSAMKIKKITFRFASTKLRSDLDLINFLLETADYDWSLSNFLIDNDCWECKSPERYLEFVENREFVLNLVMKYPLSVIYLSERFRDDKEIALAAFGHKYSTYELSYYLSDKLQLDTDIVKLVEECKILERTWTTGSSEIEQVENNTKTHLVGNVQDIQVKSAWRKGVFIENAFAVVNLIDHYGSIEIMLDSDKLKELQKMNLDEKVVFNVNITDEDMSSTSFKKINVLKIMTINELKI